VDDLEQGVLMEVEHATGDAKDDVVPGAPAHTRALAALARIFKPSKQRVNNIFLLIKNVLRHCREKIS
jgi:hypothetical protein